MHRREFLKKSAALTSAFIAGRQSRPLITDGIQFGDPLADRVNVWARVDRPGRMIVEYSTTESFQNAQRARGAVATAAGDFTARLDLRNLRAGERYFVRVLFEDRDGRTLSEPVQGSFRTAGAARRDIRFLWSADTVGQGYGINPEWGGMRTYETMRRLEPDFFIHCGDTIYADGPLAPEVRLPDGGIWRNVVTEAKSKVAETLDEFRGNYRYNFLDENLRRFNAQVPQIWQWDDHEVLNNWSRGTDLTGDDRYTVKDIRTLVARSRQAFMEYSPMRIRSASQRIYRKISYGPLLDVFVLDMRSYRAANSFNRQETAGAATAFLGTEQIRWLERDLKGSRALWKVIASDMPIGLIVGDGQDREGRPRYENCANGGGPPLGRELEIARLLGFMKRNAVCNVVWLTGDVHYTAAHFYDPAKAQFSDFNPFWEFVSGPLNAGTFGPSALDNTFGIQVVYKKDPGPGRINLPPSALLQFFGEVLIEGRTGNLTVNLRDVTNAVLFSQTLVSNC